MNAYTTNPRFDADRDVANEPGFEPDPAFERSVGKRRGSTSIVGLLRTLTSEGRELMSLELDLAKAEMRETLEVYERNAIALLMGGGVLLAALLLGAWTLNTGLTALLDQFMDLGVAVWLAPLILTIAFAWIGMGMVKKATTAIRAESPAPRKTIETLKEDKRWAERKVHS